MSRNIPNLKSNFTVKLALGIFLISALGMVTISVIINTIVRDIIYDNVIGIATRDKIIYAAEIDEWFSVAHQRVSNLASTFQMLPNDDSFDGIAMDIGAGFVNEYDIENVFIGFNNEHLLLNDLGWQAPDGWLVTERPWYIAATAVPEGEIAITPPYLSYATGNMTVALATYLPGLRDIGAVIGTSIPVNFVVDRIGQHPVASDGYLFVATSDGYIITHPNPDFRPDPVSGEIANIRDIPNGRLFMDNIAAGIEIFEFDDARLGSSYFITTPLRSIDWTLVAVIPTEATRAPIFQSLSVIMVALAFVLILLFVFDIAVITYFSRSMEESRIVEDRLRIIIEHMPLASNLRDADLNFLECNAATVKLYSLNSRDEFSERFFELSPEFQPDGSRSDEKARSLIAAAFEEGKLHFEWLHQTLDGEPIPTEVTLINVPLHHTPHLLTFIKDMRDFYKYQETERTARQRLEIILNSSPLASFITNDKFEIVEANQEVVKLFELPTIQDYIDNFFELSPKYQPDGRISRDKILGKLHNAFEEGTTRFEWLFQTLDGREILCDVKLVSVTIDDKKLAIGYMLDLRDINYAFSKVKQLEKLAYIDVLTGVNSRYYFMETAKNDLQICKSKNQDYSIIMFNIDHFKDVSSLYGHSTGDEALKAVAVRVRAFIGEDILFCRYSGDTFVISLNNKETEMATKIACDIHENIVATPFMLDNLKFNITTSFGVASKINDSDILQEIIDNAGKALNHVKKNGRNGVKSFANLPQM